MKTSGDVYCHLTEDLLDGAAAALAGAMFARERWVVYAAQETAWLCDRLPDPHWIPKIDSPKIRTA